MVDKRVDFADSIVSRIQDEKVQMRSHASIVAEAIGWATLVFVVIILFVLVANILTSWFKFGGFTPYLGLGGPGVRAFWEGFPLIWLLVGLLTASVMVVLVRHYDVSYKLPFSALVGLMILGGLVVGAALTQSGLNRPLEKRALGRHLPMRTLPIEGALIPLHHGRFGVVGEVVELPKAQHFVVQIDQDRIDVYTTTTTKFITAEQAILQGDVIRAVGRGGEPKTFHAEVIQEITYEKKRAN